MAHSEQIHDDDQLRNQVLDVQLLDVEGCDHPNNIWAYFFTVAQHDAKKEPDRTDNTLRSLVNYLARALVQKAQIDAGEGNEISGEQFVDVCTVLCEAYEHILKVIAEDLDHDDSKLRGVRKELVRMIFVIWKIVESDTAATLIVSGFAKASQPYRKRMTFAAEKDALITFVSENSGIPTNRWVSGATTLYESGLSELSKVVQEFIFSRLMRPKDVNMFMHLFSLLQMLPEPLDGFGNMSSRILYQAGRLMRLQATADKFRRHGDWSTSKPWDIWQVNELDDIVIVWPKTVTDEAERDEIELRIASQIHGLELAEPLCVVCCDSAGNEVGEYIDLVHLISLAE